MLGWFLEKNATLSVGNLSVGNLVASVLVGGVPVGAVLSVALPGNAGAGLLTAREARRSCGMRDGLGSSLGRGLSRGLGSK